jgi:hypothetical protein
LPSVAADGNGKQLKEVDGETLVDYFAGEGGADYGITNYTASQFDIHKRISHFMGWVPISVHNWVTVETVYMVKAVTLMKSMQSMKKPEIAQHPRDKYKLFIRALPLDCFADASVKIKMEKIFLCKD